MKPLTLTEEQAKKLLEMCNTLFPEHKWGFGEFYTTEVGARYEGLDYLDVTHINHKVPCVVSRFELEHHNIDTTNLKVVKKDNNYPAHDKLEYGLVNNIEPLKKGFMLNDSKVIQHSGNYDETYVEGIHWFEFCMLHLAPKVCKSDGIAITFKDNNNNPVDFLYERFLKLKK